MKRGQIKLSFGMIFSIILIIVFIAFAIFGISKFLKVQKNAQIEKFAKDFQDDVDNLWENSGSQQVEYFLPNKVKEVCFTNEENSNLVIKQEGSFDRKEIKHLNIEKTLKGKEYLCFPSNGKIEFLIKKEFNEPLVVVEKNE